MSLFIGSAPRLAERHRLRCRLPSRHHAHDALLAPNSSPGVGRISFFARLVSLPGLSARSLCAGLARIAHLPWRPARGGDVELGILLPRQWLRQHASPPRLFQLPLPQLRLSQRALVAAHAGRNQKSPVNAVWPCAVAGCGRLAFSILARGSHPRRASLPGRDPVAQDGRRGAKSARMSWRSPTKGWQRCGARSIETTNPASNGRPLVRCIRERTFPSLAAAHVAPRGVGSRHPFPAARTARKLEVSLQSRF